MRHAHRTEIGRLLPVALLALVAVGIGCSEKEDDPLGFALVEDVVSGTGPFSIRLESSDLDTFFQTTRQEGERFWAGFATTASGGLEAKTLLRFNVIIPATATILADTLKLGCDNGGDYGVEAPVRFALQRITEGEWYEDTSVSYPFDAHEIGTPMNTFEVDVCSWNDSLDTGVTHNVELPFATLTDWAQTPSANHGLAIVLQGGASLKRFRVGRSELTVRFAEGPDTTTVVMALTDHATIYTLDPTIEANGGTGSEPYALIGGAHDFRGIVRFDFDALPADANVQRLTMRLALDPSQAVVSATITGFDIGLHRLVLIPGEMLEPKPPISFFADATITHTVDIVADSTIAIDVSEFGADLADGMLIKHLDDFPPLAQFGFYTREADAALRPQLEVIYTLPATSRF